MYRLIITLALALTAGHGIAETMYEWRDDRGGRQFGQHPPADRPYQRVDIRSAPSPGAPVRSQPAAQPSKTAESPANTPALPTREQEAKRQADCDKLRENLKTLSENPRLSRKNSAGEVERIGEDERQAMIVEAKRNLATYCRGN